MEAVITDMSSYPYLASYWKREILQEIKLDKCGVPKNATNKYNYGLKTILVIIIIIIKFIWSQMYVLHKNFSSLWITTITEYQRFTTEIDITHLTNISTWIQLYTEVRKKSDVVFQKKLCLARFESGSSWIIAGCANHYATSSVSLLFVFSIDWRNSLRQTIWRTKCLSRTLYANSWYV